MVVDFPINEQLNETIDLTTDDEARIKSSRLYSLLMNEGAQAELQERSVPDGQIQAVQVEEEMEQVALDESVVELQVSEVSSVVDN